MRTQVGGSWWLQSVFCVRIQEAYEQATLNDGGLGAGLEGVGQAALSTVLTIVVESHLETNIR